MPKMRKTSGKSGGLVATSLWVKLWTMHSRFLKLQRLWLTSEVLQVLYSAYSLVLPWVYVGVLSSQKLFIPSLHRAYKNYNYTYKRIII